MDILEELRDLDKVFYEYEADNGALLDRAANEIEELRKQRNELRDAHETVSKIVDGMTLQFVERGKEIERLREALKNIENLDCGFSCQCGEVARAALKGDE